MHFWEDLQGRRATAWLPNISEESFSPMDWFRYRETDSRGIKLPKESLQANPIPCQPTELIILLIKTLRLLPSVQTQGLNQMLFLQDMDSISAPTVLNGMTTAALT